MLSVRAKGLKEKKQSTEGKSKVKEHMALRRRPGQRRKLEDKAARSFWLENI